MLKVIKIPSGVGMITLGRVPPDDDAPTEAGYVEFRLEAGSLSPAASAIPTRRGRQRGGGRQILFPTLARTMKLRCDGWREGSQPRDVPRRPAPLASSRHHSATLPGVDWSPGSGALQWCRPDG